MLREGLIVQGRVIKALFLREVKTRFGERRLGYVWAFLEPLLHIGVFILLWKVTGRMGAYGVDPILFLISGVIPYLLYTNVVAKVMKAVDSNKALLIFPQVKIMDFVIVRVLLEIITFIIVFWGLVFAVRLGGVDFEIKDFLGVNIKLFLLGFFGGCLGYLLIPLDTIMPMMGQVIRIVNRLMYFTSGVFYSIDGMPPGMKEIFIWNPLALSIHMIRTDLFVQVKYMETFCRWEYVLLLSMIMFIAADVLKKRLLKLIVES